MRKFSFTLIAILLVASIIGTAYYIRIQDINKKELSISDAFNSSGAKMIINEVYFFIRVADDLNNLDSMAKVCEEVYKTLEIDNYSKNSTSTDTIRKIDLLGTTKAGVKVSAMSSIVGNKSGAGDKYITIDTTGAEGGTALLLRDKIENVLRAHGQNAVVNSCITGTYDGKLQDSQLESICRKILNESDAKKVDSMRQENIISVSAFSPNIKDKLSIDGRNINLSLAIRYNKLEDKTYLWVATPIVNTEY